MSASPDTVFIGYVHDREQAYSWHHSFLELLGWDMAHHQRFAQGGWYGMRCGTDGLVGARNRVVREFLQSGADWLFWVDTDMGFAPDTVDQLLAVADPADRPIVGGLCFAMRETNPDGMGGRVTQPVVTIYDWAKTPDGKHGFVPRTTYPRDTVVQCSATGSACILIHRRVFERVAEKHMPAAWYDKIVLEPGSVTDARLEVSEDLSFCMRAAAVGFPTFVHTGVKTTHMKPVWLGEDRYLAETWPEPPTERVAVVVPVLSRPANVEPFLRSLRASTGLATAYFVCDPDDTAEQAEVEAQGGVVLVHDGEHGTFAVKANYGYRNTTEPWILLVGDDVCFRPGWYERALRAAGDRFHLIGTNDLSGLRRDLAVHPLIRRTWVDDHGASWDGPGVIAHEGYRHCFVDNEWTAVAAQSGVFIQAPDAVVEHLHPLFDKAPDDAIYRKGQLSYDRDQRLWEKRRSTPASGFSVEASVAAYHRQWQEIPGLVKVHEDLDRYERILERTRPEVVVECGTWTGRSAAWLADHGVDVVTIDLEDNRSVEHPRVTFLEGSSVDPEIVAKVTELVDSRRCMVILDSDHTAAHVAAELLAYEPLVSPGCYMVVEDGIVRWVPGTPCTDFGPLDAVEQFLPRSGWEHDDDLLNLHPVSHHPGGWLRRAG